MSAAGLVAGMAAARTEAASGTAATQLAAQPDRSFSFAVLGDVPYSTLDIEQTRQVLATIDEQYQFTIHIGDLKSSTESCSDSLLDERLALLGTSLRPLVFVPGDNEWTDCLKERAGSFRPFNRLDHLRQRAFSGGRSLGRQTMPFEQQARLQPRYPVMENLRWVLNGVLFVTLNRPGGVDLRNFTNDESRLYGDLHEANEAWLRSAFEQARRQSIRLLVIATHANPSFENDVQPWRRRLKRDAHGRFRRLLADLASGFDGQILFIHGDTHWFQVNQPLVDRTGEEVTNLTRLESFGTPFSASWVQVRVTPERSPMFSISTHHLDPTRRR